MILPSLGITIHYDFIPTATIDPLILSEGQMEDLLELGSLLWPALHAHSTKPLACTLYYVRCAYYMCMDKGLVNIKPIYLPPCSNTSDEHTHLILPIPQGIAAGEGGGGKQNDCRCCWLAGPALLHSGERGRTKQTTARRTYPGDDLWAITGMCS